MKVVILTLLFLLSFSVYGQQTVGPNVIIQNGQQGPQGTPGTPGSPGPNCAVSSPPGTCSITGDMTVSGKTTATTVTGSVNRVINVMAPPYNAQCDAADKTNTTLTISTAGITSGYTFAATDVGKRIVGYTTSAPFTGVLESIVSVAGGNATVTPIPASTLVTYRWYYGHDDQSSATLGSVGTGIQAAFNDAYTQNAQVQFPAGTCLTSTIIWKGPGFYGAGVSATIIQGMPGKDV